MTSSKFSSVILSNKASFIMPALLITALSGALEEKSRSMAPTNVATSPD